MGREISEPQREWLAGELDVWHASGIVNDDQVKAVLALYATPLELRAVRQSKTQLTLLALAATMIGLGVLLLIGYNWEAMPTAVKVALIFALLLGTHSLGLWLRSTPGSRGFSEAAFLFGCLIYGGGIWQLAQIFHITSENYSGFWWWALGVLPFALVLETLVLHTLLVGLLAAWVGFEILGSSNASPRLFLAPGVERGAYSLLLLAAPGFAWAYRKRSARALALYVPLVTWWVVLQPFAWRLEANPIFFIGAVGGLLLLMSEAHPDGSLMALPYRLYGACLIAGTLVPISYFDVNRHSSFHGNNVELQGLYLTSAIVVLAGATLAVITILKRQASKGSAPLADDILELARRQWFPCGIIVMMAALGFWSTLTGEPLVPTLAANAAMVVFSLWLIQTGLREDRGRPFSAGVAYFLFWAILRYIDLFGEFGGMLGAALVFFLCGATLFAVSFYWRQRKAVQLG